MPPTLLGTSKGSFSVVSANFLTSNTSFFSFFCALSDEHTPKTAEKAKFAKFWRFKCENFKILAFLM